MTGIGIDTGGTCTDAVVYDLGTRTILASAKSATTHGRLELGIGASIGKLPQSLVEEASYLSLSTTLATNACVERKGGRVCLIFIGVERRTLAENGGKYGFEGTDDMRFLDADPAKGKAPDWELFESMLPEIFAGYDSIAVSQVLARENNGAYESEARRRILERKNLTVVCAYEMFQELDVIKRGAGAFLNARLIPVIENFFDAVHRVLEERQINLPLLVMRSDGSLVSEQYSKENPVETLLCGPTASAKGAAALMPESNAVIVDMGGTTSDVAIIREGIPKRDIDGVRVGGWQTFVHGIDIDTFALGGDSRVAYRDRELSLCPERVMPVSSLADRCPQILVELGRLAEGYGGSARPLYEHLLLIKPLGENGLYYTETEREVCRILQGGPLGIAEVAEALGVDVYSLDTARLEREGVVLRSGFTPTDAMVIKGDYTSFQNPGNARLAAECAAAFIARSVGMKSAGNGSQNKKSGGCEIAGRVYELVKEKLFKNLVRILWEDAHGGRGVPEKLDDFAGEAYALEKLSGKGESDFEGCFYRNTFSTDAVLVGVGAPIHVFLPDVAGALHTVYRLSEYSGVSNALGALLGDACVYESVHIRTEYVISNWDTEEEIFVVYGEEREAFKDLQEAVDIAAWIAETRAKNKVRLCGAKEIYSVTHEVERREGSTRLGNILLGVEVRACARGRFVFR